MDGQLTREGLGLVRSYAVDRWMAGMVVEGKLWHREARNFEVGEPPSSSHSRQSRAAPSMPWELHRAHFEAVI